MTDQTASNVVRLPSRKPGDLGDSHEAYAIQLQDRLREQYGPNPVHTEGRIFAADAGIWRPITDAHLRNVAALLFQGGKRANSQRDYAQIVDRLADRVDDPEFFAAAPIGVATPSRFYTVAAGKLVHEPLAAEHRQRFALACEPAFDDDRSRPAPAPLWQTFLAQTFAGDDCAEQVDLVQEIFGAALLGLMAAYQLAVLLCGVTRAGKGVLVAILERLFPPSVVTSVSPALWGHEYHRAALAGMRLNIVGEVDAKRPIPAGDFKAITGLDRIGAREPNHAPISFRNTAAHIFSGNTFPPASERDAAFYGRWRIVQFRNSVAGREEPGIADRIAGQELAAILAWALIGAERASDRNGLASTAAHREMMDLWTVEHSSALSFLRDDEWVELRPEGFERRRPLFDAYREWCRAEGRNAMGSQHFYAEVRGHAGAWGVAEQTSGDRGFRGVALRVRP